jgi:hypothetical protein
MYYALLLFIAFFSLIFIEYTNSISDNREPFTDNIIKTEVQYGYEPVIHIVKSPTDFNQTINSLGVIGITSGASPIKGAYNMYYTDALSYTDSGKPGSVITICDKSNVLLLVSSGEISLIDSRRTTPIVIGYTREIEMKLFKIILKSQKDYTSMTNYKFIKLKDDEILARGLVKETRDIDIIIIYQPEDHPLISAIRDYDFKLVPYDNLDTDIYKFYLPYGRKEIKLFTRNRDSNKVKKNIRGDELKGQTDNDANVFTYNTLLIDTLLYSDQPLNPQLKKSVDYILERFNRYLEINYYMQYFTFADISRDFAKSHQNRGDIRVNSIQDNRVKEGFAEITNITHSVSHRDIIAKSADTTTGIITYSVMKRARFDMPVAVGDRINMTNIRDNPKRLYVTSAIPGEIIAVDALMAAKSVIGDAINDKEWTSYPLKDANKYEVDDILYIPGIGRGIVIKDGNKLLLRVNKYGDRAIINAPNMNNSASRFDPQYICYQDPRILDERECVDKYDKNGAEKPVYTWDRPCQDNLECPFYLANKRYPNERGGCMAGYCELPVGVKRVSFREYDREIRDNNYPRCYGCKEDDPGCCEKQKKNGGGPDYAFADDREDRRMHGL